MKYYLVPIEEVRTFDKNVNDFLKIIYPKIYNLYKRNYIVDCFVTKALEKNNLPTHILFQSKQKLNSKQMKVVEPITEIELKFPLFYCLAHEVTRQRALFYLRNLSEQQIESVAISFYKFIYERKEKCKIIEFPLKKL